MKAHVIVTGGSLVVKNLKAKNAAIGTAVSQGLLIAGFELLRMSQQLVPVEFGVLKASGYVRQPKRYEVNVGYTAFYALFVHEQVGMVLQGQQRLPSPPHQGRYWDPQGRAQAKFLEAPFRGFKPTAIKIVALRVQGVLI